jgi:hypothetical protein
MALGNDNVNTPILTWGLPSDGTAAKEGPKHTKAPSVASPGDLGVSRRKGGSNEDKRHYA